MKGVFKVTNEQIIYENAISAGIFTEEEAMSILEKEGELPLHSLSGWKIRSPKGYEIRIRKGEHAILTINLWKKKKKKKSEPITEENEEEQKETDRDFYLTKTFLFSDKQIEMVPIKEGDAT